MGHHGQSPGPKAEPCSRSQRGPCPAEDAVREVQTMTRLWIEEGIGLYLKLLSFHQLLAVANVTQSERHHAYSQGSAGPWRSPSPVLLTMFLTKYKACSITVHPVQKHPPQFIVHFQIHLLTVFQQHRRPLSTSTQPHVPQSSPAAQPTPPGAAGTDVARAGEAEILIFRNI